MKDPQLIHRPTFPIAYPQLVLEIAAERGHQPEQVLTQCGLPVDLLQCASGRITPMQYTLITIAAAQLTGDQGIGMEVGLRMRPTAHGFLGYALMSCNTLRDALLLSLRFMRLRQRHIHTAFHSEGNQGVISLREVHSFGPVRHFFMEGMLIGISRSAQYMMGTDQLLGELWFDYPEPDYVARYRDRLPRVRFNMPAVQLRFDTHYLEQPLRLSDPIATQQAIEQCERELAMLNEADDFLPSLRSMLSDCIDKNPRLDDVASSLFMSGRTLKRRLQLNGTSFQKLLDDIRFEEAKRLMRYDDLSLQQIAQRLGYEDPANFTRAFRKWSGDAPSRFRQRHSI